MKKLILGVAALGLLASCGGDKEDKKEKGDTVIETKVTSANAGDLTIGYYDMEKLYTDFEFVSTNSKKMESEVKSVEERLMSWQNIAQSSYNKMQDPSLSVDQSVAYDRKMQEAQKMIQQIQQGEAYDLQVRQAEFNATVEKKLLKYSEEFGQENGIKLIFARGAGSGISYIDGAFDITDQFIAYMNAKEKAIDEDLKSDNDTDKEEK